MRGQKFFLGISLFLPLVIGSDARSQGPLALLARADRLAMLYNWPEAAPLYKEAESLFKQSGDDKGTLSARLGYVWATADAGVNPSIKREIVRYVADPLLRSEPMLRLRALVAKAVLDRNENEQAARGPWKEILDLATRLGDQRWTARAQAEIGQILYMDGDIKSAAAMLRDGIVSQYLHFDLGAAIHYTGMVGNGFVETGQPEAGLRYCDIVLKTSHLVPDLGFPFLAYQGKARALLALHRDAEANAVLDVALEHAREQRNHFALAQLLIVRGTGAASRNPREAIQALKEAHEISGRNGFQHVFAWSAFELAGVYGQVDDLDEAERLASKTVEFMRDLDDIYHLPQHLALLASLESSKGEFLRADELYSEATDVMNALLVNVVRRQLKSSLIATLSDAYVRHFELAAMKFDNIGKAYEIIEEARGRALADTLRGESESLASSSDEISIEATQEITRIQLALMHESDPKSRELLLDQLFGAEQLLAPEPRLRSNLSLSADKRRVVPLSNIQRSLRADEMLLEYVLGESQSYCLRISRTDAEVITLPAGRKAIEKLVDDYLGAIRERQMEIAAGRELFSLVLQPVIGQKSTRRLIIVPDGKLNLLPFDGLKGVEDRRYVLESHVVTYAPSASVLHLLRESRYARSVKPAFLGIGDVNYPPLTSAAKVGITDVRANSVSDFFELGAVRFPDLPGSAQEVKGVAETIGGIARLLFGDNATEAGFKSLPLADFGIIHFAVHGVANTQFPDRAALALSASPASGEDGLLQVREIRDLPLQADLVVLSACDTGNGKLLGEEGIASLERAFLLAGARSVLASLWTADDTYTVALMRRFYEHLVSGMDNGAALRQAKLDLLHKFSEQALPIYWAGFTLVGNGEIVLLR